MSIDLRSKHDLESRRRAVELFDAGVGCKPAAEALSVPRETVREWQWVYRAFGSEALLSMDGKQSSYTFEQRVAARGWRAAYPCMLSAAEAAACGQRMCMRAVAADDASAAPFITHPTRTFAAADIGSNRFPIVPAEALDMIVVPLVAFDQTGARLGYGGGCYDRYLSMLSPACQIVGIAFDEQRIDHVPTDVHDLPLPNIVSA